MTDNEVDFSLLLRPEVPTRNFASGDTIFKEGDHADEFFVVVRGKVEIRNGNRRLEILGPKGIFGEMALIDDSPRSATVTALTVASAPVTRALTPVVAIGTNHSSDERATATLTGPSASPPHNQLPRHLSVSLRI